VGAAVANAVANALGEGAAPRHLPVTARRVKAAIEASRKPS
jgi:CO/xanthine dehydrogenase Mo-binding subunit